MMDPCMWASAPPLRKAPEFGFEDVDVMINEWENENTWDSEGGCIVLLKDGTYGYMYTWNDMTFDGGHSYRSETLEDLIKWGLTEYERFKMGYDGSYSSSINGL